MTNRSDGFGMEAQAGVAGLVVEVSLMACASSACSSAFDWSKPGISVPSNTRARNGVEDREPGSNFVRFQTPGEQHAMCMLVPLGCTRHGTARVLGFGLQQVHIPRFLGVHRGQKRRWLRTSKRVIIRSVLWRLSPCEKTSYDLCWHTQFCPMLKHPVWATGWSKHLLNSTHGKGRHASHERKAVR